MLWCNTERCDLWWQALIANEFLFLFKEGQIDEWNMHVRLSKGARNQSLRQEAQRRNSFNSLPFGKYYLQFHSYTFHDFVCSEIQSVIVMIRVRPLACLSIKMKGLVAMFYIWFDVIIKGFLILCSYFSVLKMNYNFIISWIRGSQLRVKAARDTEEVIRLYLLVFQCIEWKYNISCQYIQLKFSILLSVYQVAVHNFTTLTNKDRELKFLHFR